MPIEMSFDPAYEDVDNNGYVSGPVSVTSTAIEAKVGANRLIGRQSITITNKGSNTLYYGPSGVTTSTGDVLYKDQFVSLPFGELIGIYLICASGQSATAIVQEMG